VGGSPPSPLTPPFSTRRRVEFRDTDAAGIVHFSVFFGWMEAAEHALLREAGVPLVVTHDDGSLSSWPRVSAGCDYRSPVRFGDEVDIGVAIEAVGRASVTYAFTFSSRGLPVATGRIVAVHCRIRGGAAEPEPMPDELARRLERFGHSAGDGPDRGEL